MTTVPSSVVETPASINEQVGKAPLTQMSSSRRLALLVIGVFSAMLAIGCIAALACGIVHPLAIVGVVLSILVSGAMFALIRRGLRQPALAKLEPTTPLIEPSKQPEVPSEQPEVLPVVKRPKPLVPPKPVPRAIPEGCFNIIKSKYSSAIAECCEQQNLSVRELGMLLDHLQSSSLSSLDAGILQKVKKFGLEKLEPLQGRQFLSLDYILAQNCPLYMMKRFIDLGSEEFPKVDGLPPEVYWTSPLGLVYPTVCTTAFNPCTCFFAKIVKEEEYAQLVEAAKNCVCLEEEPVFQELVARMENQMGFLRGENIGSGKGQILYGYDSPHRVAMLCKHGVSWKQLELLKCVDVVDMHFLGQVDGNTDRNLMKLMSTVYPCLNEESRNYHPATALLTFSELKEFVNDVKTSSPEETKGPDVEGFVTWLSGRDLRKRLAVEAPSSEDPRFLLPMYHYNLNSRALSKTPLFL
ncbi:DUF1389 domain-containing protein [Chlamydia vaughanii]|uniref:DUF1389 domain-containing protein n=1 Tax=Chlamydia vaughanii TaxID=3112552 RepID=UPI0032B15D1F